MAMALLSVACGNGLTASDSGSNGSRPTPTVTTRVPNIVLILTDDQETTSFREMPRVQSLLVEQGTTFTSAFATTPLCAPSRASILTGVYAHNHGVRHNALPLGGYQAFREAGWEQRALPTWLRNAGYRTGYFGKYMNDYGPDWGPASPGWDEWVAFTEPQAYFGFTFNDNGIDRRIGDGQHQTDFLSDRSLAFLRGTEARDDQPFFLFLAPYAPHAPSIPATRHAADFSGRGAPRTPSFDEADVSDKPAHIRVIPRFSDAEIADRDNAYRSALRAVEGVDEMVERVINSLRDLGELDNTVIFLLSDNGYSFGAHRFTDKKVPYDEALQIPFVVRGPGISRGARQAQLVANIDVAPTIAEMARATAPSNIDGRSLVPLFGASSVATWRQDILIEFWSAGRDALPDYVGLRAETAAESSMFARYPNGDREVYDLRADPFQLEGRPSSRPELASRLESRVGALVGCSGATCR